MTNVLIVDTETTGLDPNKGATLIEIAAILYNVKYKTVLQNFSTLFACDDNPVEDVNHIIAEATQCDMPQKYTNDILKSMLENSKYVVAHNAEFDKKFIGLLSVGNDFLHKRWICTKKDFKWPVHLFRNRLQDICVAMGVNYVDAHRALADCNFLAQCFSRVDNLEQAIEAATSNRQTFTHSNRFV